MPETILDRYKQSFPDIPGWFTEEAMCCWELLFSAQRDLEVTGDFCEIGVWKGRSAVLGAMYLLPQEWCVLIDINPVPEAQSAIETFRTECNRFLTSRSQEPDLLAELAPQIRKCRWVHIDGNHEAPGVLADLDLAARLLYPAGIICCDDFFNFRYPQLTGAVYRFLFGRPDFRIFFAGGNKAYLCRSAWFDTYDNYIRSHFVQVADHHACNAQLNRTSPSKDGGHFTISWREGDRRICGRDEDVTVIPA